MTDIQRCRDFAVERAKKLGEERQDLIRQLLITRLFGWPLLVASIVCPVAAGSLSLIDKSFDWAVPVLSFVGAAAVALHKGLHCETYQSGLARSVQSIQAAQEAFEFVAAKSDDDVDAAITAAERKLRDARKGFANRPADDS